MRASLSVVRCWLLGVCLRYRYVPTVGTPYLRKVMAERYIIELTEPGRRKFWEELLSQLDFIKVTSPAKAKPVKKTKKEKEFQDGLREAILEMKEDLAGRKKMQSARDFLDELQG